MESDAGTESKSPWKKTTIPCLIRYEPTGQYFLRARFGGEPVREDLETRDFLIAKAKHADRMKALRSNARARSHETPATLQDALDKVRASVAADPTLKPGTRTSYFEALDRMRTGNAKAGLPTMLIAKFTETDAQTWWALAAKAYAPQQANHLLMFLRRALKLARKRGAMSKDPAEDLKRVPIPRTRLELPTLAQFYALVADVRGQGKAHSQQAGDWIEFMTYAGPRPKEIREFMVTDIFLERGFLRFTGGEDRTKNRKDRWVPIIPPMRDLLERMKAGGRLPEVGRVFTIIKPRDALKNACKRLSIPHQRIYNLRHLFATTCAEAGVPVPTFAEWLGHQDGGGLAMDTYVQGREKHQLDSAAKVKF